MNATHLQVYFGEDEMALMTTMLKFGMTAVADALAEFGRNYPKQLGSMGMPWSGSTS